MYQGCLKIRDQEDPYKYKIMSDPLDTVKTLTMKHVADWDERWKRHLGRLRVTLAASDFLLTPPPANSLLHLCVPTPFVWLNHSCQ
jgi:hypothetical protein